MNCNKKKRRKINGKSTVESRYIATWVIWLSHGFSTIIAYEDDTFLSLLSSMRALKLEKFFTSTAWTVAI